MGNKSQEKYSFQDEYDILEEGPEEAGFYRLQNK